MTASRIRLIVPGALSAGVAATILVSAGKGFSAEPLGDGRWAVEAEVEPATASMLQLHAKTEIAADAPPAAAPAPPPVPAPVSVADVGEKVTFKASTVAAAKTTALRLAAKHMGATAYPGQAWAAEGSGGFARGAYRGKRTGLVVIGAAVGGGWFVGWRNG